MIRRAHLASLAGWTGEPPLVTRVKRGESVRITGLGTLARVVTPAPVSAEVSYRLTLIAAVAKDYSVGYEATALETDVRHLARALGAPVEVWSPYQPRAIPKSTVDAKRITTVHA